MKNFFSGLGTFIFSAILFINISSTSKRAALSGSGISASSWPKACLAILMILSFILMVQSVADKTGSVWKEIRCIHWRAILSSSGTIRFLAVCALCFAYVESLKYIGFYFGSILFLTLMLFLLGFRNLKHLLPGPIILSTAVMLLFAKGIGVPLPPGRGVFGLITEFLS